MGVTQINVLVASTSPDFRAGIISEAVRARADMNLLSVRPVAVSELDERLASIPAYPRCALVIVGPPSETNGLAERWLSRRPDVAVMDVDMAANTVRITVRAPGLDRVLTALRELVEHAAVQPPQASPEPAAAIRLVETSGDEAGRDDPGDDGAEPPKERPLLDAAITWVHQLLRDAVANVPDDNGDMHGLSLTRETLLQALAEPAVRRPSPSLAELTDADEALESARAEADPNDEPLAAAARAFALDGLEFRMLLLALAPELDLRFQRCIGFLLDDMGRRTGTLALYSRLLGADARVRVELAGRGTLLRWLVFDAPANHLPAADEPLRVDPFLGQWLLGDRLALQSEPRVRRLLRFAAWPGAALLDGRDERKRAEELTAKATESQWLLLAGNDPGGWRALLELGDEQRIRVELARLAGMDILDVEDAARRVGRMTRLLRRIAIVDAAKAGGTETDDESRRVFFAALRETHCRLVVISADATGLVTLLGATPYELLGGPALSADARVSAVQSAARQTGAYLTGTDAETIVHRYPLSIDRLEHAVRLARSRPEARGVVDAALLRFTAAVREVAGEGISHLAERIEPVFTLEQVVLPADRKQQLEEIVDHVRLAPRVLDEWKFGEQLPYGRGVAALFHGPSGTGKTMAAMGIAHQLGIQLLRFDFSKVVSKYIGDTEKNIDRVFTDAQTSGAAILIDEADALLGKRSEVKDAHDRYANIEVAYLLQRMEAYEGLAILTTNMRQNLDPAFLRRLRFIVEFPRPDADAREQIWRQCLPAGAHELDDASFRQLARRVDLTGGHIRQITLRAAFLAAAAGVQIALGHIAQAARAELAKLGMPPVDLDLGTGKRAA